MGQDDINLEFKISLFPYKYYNILTSGLPNIWLYFHNQFNNTYYKSIHNIGYKYLHWYKFNIYKKFKIAVVKLPPPFAYSCNKISVWRGGYGNMRKWEY
ncbi:hypothetical protein XV74_17680 [Vibrio cholerae]|nr:hypothetical protein XV74_17680 [Vibrio cholerae]KQA40694.1 hypothetical protein XV75_17860 [Vibrio cholerae]KQA52848.1 hypothetical protein XV79_17790 [Vibrio cholerae]KQA73172.1 hypothetical protein XV84_13395 [Vibrio cholerae]KQA74453.1 hypothetical protein XV85_17740 [Vibrio cholerae]